MNPSRNTVQRVLILSILEHNRTHPTADEIYRLACQKKPRISRGTVYRNLNLLVETGQIRRLTTPDGPDHFDRTLDNHYHFFCRNCRRMVDAALPYQEELNKASASLPGYHTECHRLLLIGLCPDCSR